MDWRHVTLDRSPASRICPVGALCVPLEPSSHSTRVFAVAGPRIWNKVLNGLAPRYLGPLTCVADLPGRRALRSTSSNRLHIPPVRLSTVGTRVFSVAGPHIWNNLPEYITSARTVHTFGHRLKTHCFSDHIPNIYQFTSIFYCYFLL